ncbi:uncharacterized protein LOC131036882 isoform X3 [Cryptomeria japonica]|uniref:uncharacterized protein LOC131036882 isoform X3 n=1 Tax=Cryptomeria japonica TaxID=3369 RepID=UPI0027DAB1E1|nr:uncharacterized protein LOC131036882 isoform X3 [Cryptomeria japonica]
MNLDLTEASSEQEETLRWFQDLTIRGLLPNEAADLAWKVANGIVARPVDHLDLMKDFELATKVSSREESLVLKIRTMFSSLDSLSINFLPKDGSTGVVAGLDMALVRKFYNSAKELDRKDVVAAIMESTESLLSLDEGSWTKANSISLRNVITLLENSFFNYSEYYGTLQKLWKLILNQPAHVKANLLLALQSYDRDQLERLLATVQQFITILVYETPINDKVEAGVQILEFLYRVNEKSQVVDHMFFYNDAVNSEDFNIVADFKIWMERSSFSFCNYPFVYDTSSKSKILQLDSTMQMRNEFQDAIFRSILFEGTCPYLVLRVRRENLIRETILQIRSHTEDLKKPLKVQFIGEDGIDEGGVQKEFFQLLVRDIFDPKYGMFSYNEETRLFWFNNPPWDVSEEFELVGIVLGLAIYNGHILELHFPKVVYKKLLGKVPTIEDLAEVDPGLAKGLKQLLQFDGDVEETFCRSFQVSVHDIFGEVGNIELKENGSDIPVTKANRKEYVDLCVKYYLETSIELSFEAFRKGFQRLWRGRVLQLFQPAELEQLICGSPVLDFEALEKYTIYEDGYRKDSRIVREFWEIIHSLDKENKKKLLFFVTGSDRAPIKGLANLRFVISKNAFEENHGIGEEGLFL